MKMIITLAAFALFFAMLPATVSADTAENEIRERLNNYELDKYDSEISSLGEIEGLEGEKFSDIVYGALNGTLSLSFADVLKMLLGRLFKEVYGSLEIMRSLIIIALLGAVLASLTTSFGESSIGEIGFYIVYIALVSLLISSFFDAAQIASDAVSRMAAFIHALIPLIAALLLASGRYAVSFVFHPAAMGVIQIAAYLINNVIINVIIFAAAVQMVNFLLPKGALDNMAELVCNIIGKSLWVIAVVFMAVLSLQTVTAPLMGGIIGRGAKIAVSSVPFVGQVFTGAVDSVFYWGNAVKNGVAAAAVIFVSFICFVPVLKLAAIVMIYKITAALIQPVSDERIVECIDAAGNYASLLIGAVMCVCVMFVVLLMMVMAGAAG